MTSTRHTTVHPSLGAFSLRPVDLQCDIQTLHRWLTHPKSAFWEMGTSTLADVEREYHAIAADPHRAAFLGLHTADDTEYPSFLLERYDPAHRELVGCYDARPGDVGMHFLVAPTSEPRSGFTRAVITTVMDFLFADERVHRVVVEPDAHNHRVRALNVAVGFEVDRALALPTKTALLSFCTREQYRAARDWRGHTP